MQIFIPTRGRVNKQITLSILPPSVLEKTWLVVPSGEAKAFNYARIMEAPREIKGISATRAYIMEKSKDSKVVLIDDDVKLCIRRKQSRSGAWCYELATANEIKLLFEIADSLLDTFSHGGMTHRQDGWAIKSPILLNQRCYDLAFYNRASIGDKAVFRLELMEDFDFTLQLLKAGLPNFHLTEYAISTTGSNSEGGCSLYRTAKMQADCAHRLAALHPGLVKPVQRNTKSSWGGGARTDVRISWKKAYSGPPLDETRYIEQYEKIKQSLTLSPL